MALSGGWLWVTWNCGGHATWGPVKRQGKKAGRKNRVKRRPGMLRPRCGAGTIALDVPSGLFGADELC